MAGVALTLRLNLLALYPTEKSALPYYNTSADPPKGRKIVLSGKQDAFGRSLRAPAGPVLFMVMGSCSECSASHFDPKRINAKRFGLVVLYFWGDKRDLPVRFRRLTGNYRVVMGASTDPLVKSLNAMWQPRAYVLDAGWRISDIQKSPDVAPPDVLLGGPS